MPAADANTAIIIDNQNTATATADAACSPPASKKQRKASSSSTAPKTTAVKAVKAVDPAIINQRREAVQARVLKLESKLAKDRALLAKYTVAPPSAAAAELATISTNGCSSSDDASDENDKGDESNTA